MDLERAEELIAGLWAEMLKEHVTPEDNFFGLGGNSLQMTQMLWTVETKAGVKVSLIEFLEDPTPRALARLCIELSEAAPL